MSLEQRVNDDPRSTPEIKLERNSGLVLDSLLALGFPVAAHYGMNHYELGTLGTVSGVVAGTILSGLAAYSGYLNYIRDGEVLERRKLE